MGNIRRHEFILDDGVKVIIKEPKMIEVRMIMDESSVNGVVNQSTFMDKIVGLLVQSVEEPDGKTIPVNDLSLSQYSQMMRGFKDLGYLDDNESKKSPKINKLPS